MRKLNVSKLNLSKNPLHISALSRTLFAIEYVAEVRKSNTGEKLVRMEDSPAEIQAGALQRRMQKRVLSGERKDILGRFFLSLNYVSSCASYVLLCTPTAYRGQSLDHSKLCKTVRQKRLSSLAANSETSYRHWRAAKGLFSHEIRDKPSSLHVARKRFRNVIRVSCSQTRHSTHASSLLLARNRHVFTFRYGSIVYP